MFLKRKQPCHLVCKVNAALIFFLRKFDFSFLCNLSNYLSASPKFLDNNQAERLHIVQNPLKNEMWYNVSGPHQRDP